MEVIKENSHSYLGSEMILARKSDTSQKASMLHVNEKLMSRALCKTTVLPTTFSFFNRELTLGLRMFAEDALLFSTLSVLSPLD